MKNTRIDEQITKNPETCFPFQIKKEKISVLQINLGRKCNLSCTHCHVEASPLRKEELSDDAKKDILYIINTFDQIKTIDLTGGAPEMHNGFREIVEAARSKNKEVIIRSNLTIFFVEGYEDLPDYLANNECHIVASLPCYLEDNVDAMRGKGVFRESIKAIQELNKRGYGKKLTLDLVYNPPLPENDEFELPPSQDQLKIQYKQFLRENFNIEFNNLYTITNLPIGRFKTFLKFKNWEDHYLTFLQKNINKATLPHLMCKNQLSVDFKGNIYDCDFNQMEDLRATCNGQEVNLKKIVESGSLDIIESVRTGNPCFGCTAGCGSSCAGSLT